jgi:hypothetical protein
MWENALCYACYNSKQFRIDLTRLGESYAMSVSMMAQRLHMDLIAPPLKDWNEDYFILRPTDRRRNAGWLGRRKPTHPMHGAVLLIARNSYADGARCSNANILPSRELQRFLFHHRRSS